MLQVIISFTAGTIFGVLVMGILNTADDDGGT